jgi:hypothetical protein
MQSFWGEMPINLAASAAISVAELWTLRALNSVVKALACNLSVDVLAPDAPIFVTMHDLAGRVDRLLQYLADDISGAHRARVLDEDLAAVRAVLGSSWLLVTSTRIPRTSDIDEIRAYLATLDEQPGNRGIDP